MEEKKEYISYLESLIRDPKRTLEEETSLKNDKTNAETIYNRFTKGDIRDFLGGDPFSPRRDLRYAKRFSLWKMETHPSATNYNALLDNFVNIGEGSLKYHEKLKKLEGVINDEIKKESISRDMANSYIIFERMIRKFGQEKEDPVDKSYKFSLWKSDWVPEGNDYDKLIDEYSFLDDVLLSYRGKLREIKKETQKGSIEEESIEDDIKYIELIINLMYRYYSHINPLKIREEFNNLLVNFSQWKMKRNSLLFNIRLINKNEIDKYRSLIDEYMKGSEKPKLLEDYNPLNSLMDLLGSFIPHI